MTYQIKAFVAARNTMCTKEVGQIFFYDNVIIINMNSLFKYYTSYLNNI